MTKDIQKTLYTPMLSLSGGLNYQRKITDGLWTILTRARQLAEEHKDTLVKKGSVSTLPIRGSIRGDAPITFVIYHVPFEAKADQSIGSFDVPVIDHSKINHAKLVRQTIKAILSTHPQAEVVLCTDEAFGAQMQDLGVSLIYPEVERNRPMYYRAKTYNTLVQAKAIQGTTVFLDSDAIVLRPMTHLPEALGFDVAVTQRFAPNLMPINEGVIIARANTKTCKDFFAHYMGTYDLIKDDTVVQRVCGNDLMRWRGGQLSLNAMLSGGKMKNSMSSESFGIKILDCTRFNYSVSKIHDVDNLRTAKSVYIAHVKGKAKLGV